MPPIRKGDGTPVTPKGISQIRTGDGRILFDGVAIPDSAFEQVANRLAMSEGSGTALEDSVGDDDATIDGPTWVDDSNFTGGFYLDFDGDNDVADSNAPNRAGSMAVALTITFESDISSSETMYFQGPLNDPGVRTLMIGDDGTNVVRWRIHDGSNQSLTHDLGTPGTYRLVGVIDADNDQQILYVNGDEVDSQSVTGDLSTTPDSHSLGYRNPTNDDPVQYFSGGLDDHQLVSGAPTAQEVQDDYNQQPWS